MNWTEEELADRNRRIFGEPPAPALPAPRANESESLIQAEILSFLHEDGWRTLVTTPVSRRAWGTGFGETGMPDAILLRPMQFIPSVGCYQYACEVAWCEFKAGTEKAKKHQIEWHTKERARGFMVWVANETFLATVEGFRSFYERSGLMRRPKWW